MPVSIESRGTAEREGRLWGARARDWAAQEDLDGPRYAAALERLDVGPGRRVLEVGCGSGAFLRMAADRGARVDGLDASAELVAIARERVHEACVVVGDMQFLPYEDDSFDVVAGFNAFFFAGDMVAALREAARVAKPGGAVVIQVFGRAERTDMTAMLRAMRALRPSVPDVQPGPPLSQPGVLEGIAQAAGLAVETTFDFSFAYEYPDAETLLRLMLSAGGIVEATSAAGESVVRAVILDALAPFRTPGGGYRLRNEWHYLIARA